MKKEKAVKATPKKTKRTTAVTVHTSKPQKEMVWSNASQIMTSSREDIKTAVAQQMMNLATAVFKLPPQGITILANQPYLNKIGWQMKKREYYKENVRTKVNWHHLATPNEKYAICEAVIETKNEKTGEWEYQASATGEASPTSIKLAAVKETLNMMAETRAKNRATSDFIGARTLEDAVKTLNAMREKKEVTEEQAHVITEAARVTAEEMGGNETKTVDSQKAFSFFEKMKVELHKLGAQNARQAIEMINKITDAQLSSLDEVDENMAKVILVELNKR